jgi:predicted nucleic acid-binding protein
VTPRALVLDTEAVAALARQDRRVLPMLVAAREAGSRVMIPAAVLVELITGKPADAAVWHVVRRLDVRDVTARAAARAGVLRERASAARRKKRDLSLDAMVAALAEELAPSSVVTADPGDFEILTAGADVRVVALAPVRPSVP